jgi:hypothetical protein
MSVTISGNLDPGTALKFRIASNSENRSVSNAVASAVAIFVDLPKEFRDLVLELHAKDDQVAIRKLGREVMLAATRVKFEKGTSALATEGRFGGPDTTSTEADILSEATRLTKEEFGRKR